MRLRVRFAVVATVLAGLAFAHDAAADLSDASLSAGEKRAIAASGLPRNLVVSAKPELVVAIRNRGAPSAGGIVEGVTLQGEVVSSETAQIVGYRSMRSTVNIDCVRRRDMVTKMTVFAEHGAKGASVTRQVPGGWVQPSPDAYLGAVIRSICGSAPRIASASPAPETKPPPATRAAPSQPVQAKAPAPRPASRDNVQIAAAPPVVTPRETPDLDRPLRTSPEVRLGRAMIATATPVPVAKPPPAPVVAPAPKPAPPPATKVLPAQAKAPAPRPKTAGKVSVQIAAASTERQAREALAKQKGKVTAPLSTAVRSVTVDGKVFHRALVTGFQTRAEAQAFCSRLKADCFVR